MQEIVKMVSVNLFSHLTSGPHESKVINAFDLEKEEHLMDPAWPHLQIVYELLLRFVASPETDANSAKRYIDHSFILRSLDLFDSEDPRERVFENCSSPNLWEVHGAMALYLNGNQQHIFPIYF